MANSLGALIVSLGLDAAEFVRGLTKAENQAKQFARNTKSAINEVEKELAKLAIGKLILDSTKAIIEEAAALDDLADATGSTVEAISKLNNQAKISGTEFATLQTAVLKLSAGMAGTDEETSKAKEALKLLGVTARDPVEAMQQVALSLAKYEDGVNKVGLAVALFGKQGAALLPLLKDMAESQDVQATITTKQAAEAEKLEKQWRALQTRATEFSVAILNDLVPALNRLLSLTKESGGAGLFAALGLSSEDEANARRALDETAAGLVDLKKKRDAFTNQGVVVKLFSADDIAILDQQIKVAEARQKALQKIVDAQFVPHGPERPEAPALAKAGGGGAKGLKEQTTEAQRLLESLEKQNERTLELTHTEQFLRDVQMDRVKGLTPALTDQILKQTQLLDSSEALKKSEEERKKTAEETARSQQRIAEATNHAVKSAMQEVEATKQGNEQLQEQIAFLKGGQEAVDRLTDAKLASTIAEKEATLAALQHLEADKQLIDATAEQIRVLRERQVLIGDKRAAEAAAEEARKAKQFADELGASLAQGAENAILHFNNLRDVLHSLEQDLLRIITRQLVTKPLGDFLSGAIGSVLGGFGGTPGATPPIFPGFASGGTSPGGWATVGEQGPEVVHLPRGAQVIPNDVLMGKRAARNVVVNINVPAGASRSTIDQTRLQFGLELQRVLDRSG